MINIDNLGDYIHRLRQGERAALAQAMTLAESSHPQHQELSALLLDHIMPYTGQAKRLGVTGTPGAGKSTFLEALGEELLSQGHKVAVIAVDPSSPASGGSILGDKTRMLNLSRAEHAFVRPVPSRGYLGGISQTTRELILLCEAAGYDIVIVETVGVGQSETEVAAMVDCFISLQIAGAGDDLQGIKKGIMEMADFIVINKDDGENHINVDIARHMYHSALHIIRRKHPLWQPRVLTCSALEKRGIRDIWQAVETFWSVMAPSGQLAALRERQNLGWVRQQTEANALAALFTRPDLHQHCLQIEALLQQNHISPRAGIRAITDFITQKIFS
ncbi:methylmalonyl Co-A mutase-associated GTPase MeaB [Yersinia sp. 2105 StPb PI]|uniref:methylmalonyl Co-A mutase-associated GTPase MeaB n=1 Tax=Yersinia sp. 2105 StPb PI TaxID=2507058 RepID=UPI000FFB4EFF|nr:methylmalonyl Co-A mutase-associated GTPase MeaB [Yersinia sp. 2105 StPb PI]RXA97994.1 methylmalonyl Co-A mutase-associated GTPase MeaB [Yersinia sp. 2105 StPb PI]